MALPKTGMLGYTLVTDARWVNSQHTRIECRVKFVHLPEPVWFVADQNDVTEHGRDIFRRLVNNEFFGIAEYVDTDVMIAFNPHSGPPNVVG